MWALIITEMVSSVGVMAVVSDVVKEWSRPLTSSGDGFNPIIITIIIASIIVFLLFNGRYTFVEKILALFVGVMGLSFILSSFTSNLSSVPSIFDSVEGAWDYLLPI